MKRRECSPADLLFYAEQVRSLINMDPAQVGPCAELIAQHLEWHARCLLEADVRQGQA